MLITKEYRELNRQLHDDRPSYGAAGHKWAFMVSALCRSLKTHDVLDYGAGKGTLSKALGFDISEYDPCLPEISLLPKPADIVVCTDVLEHIEPDCLEYVLRHIHILTKRRALLVISTRPAHKNLPDGRNAHLLVYGREWWLEKLNPLFLCASTPPINNGDLALICIPKSDVIYIPKLGA